MSEEKVMSMELSKALKGAGVEQESERSWEPIKYPYLSDPDKIYWENRPFHTDDGYSSFDCHELLERLPVCTGIVKLDSGLFKADNWWLDGSVSDRLPAEALGKLLLWCHENGHIKKAKP